MAGDDERDDMTTPHSDARPPRWAEAILRLLLAPEDRETVSGDLLEEYRETIVPARGPAADWWYLRQAASFLWRASWVWGAVIGAALVIRYGLDTLVPPADYRMRAAVLTYTIMAACLLAGFRVARRTRSIRAGVLTSFSGAVVGALLSIVGAAVLLAIWHDPATLGEWRRSGGLDETFIDVPLKIVAFGGVLGSAGAVLGKSAAKSLPRAIRKSA
jgi:hypothetical protein